MRVRDLINFLHTRDPDARIVISAHEGGVNECQTAIAVNLTLNANEKIWYPGLGLHEISFKGQKRFTEDTNLVEAVLLQ